MSAIFTPYGGGTAYTVIANGMTATNKSNNKITPVKNSNPVIVKLGKTKQVMVTCRVYGATDIAIVNAWTGETVITVSSSSYGQLPNGNYLCKSVEVKEKPGYLDIYDVKFDLEYYFSGAVI